MIGQTRMMAMLVQVVTFAVCGLCGEMPREVTVTEGIPSDAEILYDGTSLDKWRNINGGPAIWHIQPDGTLLVDKTGNTPGKVLVSIYTKDVYTNFQMHVEYRIPEDVDYTNKWRGNSGIKIFGCDKLQSHNDHSRCISFRNVWIRRLGVVQ